MGYHGNIRDAISKTRIAVESESLSDASYCGLMKNRPQGIAGEAAEKAKKNSIRPGRGRAEFGKSHPKAKQAWIMRFPAGGKPRETPGPQEQDEEMKVRRPVSRVLSTPCGDGWPFLWDVRCRTPLATDPGGGAETPLPVARRAAPIWSCSRWGLPCRFRCRSRGGLLPHRFHPCLAGDRPKAGQPGGLFSVALSLGSPPPAVSRHRVSMEPGLSSPLAERSHPAV